MRLTASANGLLFHATVYLSFFSSLLALEGHRIFSYEKVDYTTIIWPRFKNNVYNIPYKVALMSTESALHDKMLPNRKDNDVNEPSNNNNSNTLTSLPPDGLMSANSSSLRADQDGLTTVESAILSTPGPIIPHMLKSCPITDKSLYTEIEVKFVSPTQVFVQSPGVEDRYITKTLLYESWASLTVPRGHTTLASFTYFLLTFYYTRRSHCSSSKDRVELYNGTNVGKNLIWRACDYDPSMKRVLHATLLVVGLHSTCYGGGQLRHNGFQLHFSFHRHSAPMLQQVSDKMWNCSVPQYSDFALHFACDLVQDCVGGEDEKNCSYTGHCGKGRLTIGGRCYQYIERPQQPVTWIDANMECGKRGGYLASLNTKQEWSDVFYRGIARWADQTTAFYSSYYYGKNKIMCGCFTNRNFFSAKIGTDCLKPVVQNFLCEEDQPKQKHNIRLLIPTNQSFPFPTVDCPRGHNVHTFLACDALSDCWTENIDDTGSDETGNNYGLQSSCLAPLSFNPPSFTCQDGVQRVPYSLVCDHKTDCADRSDENFCTFPHCEGNMVHCDSFKQCISQDKICDGQKDCHYGTDEDRCEQVYTHMNHAFPFFEALPSPALIHLNPKNWVHQSITMDTITPLDAAASNYVCPESHFPCADNGYCLPIYLRCNGYFDCPNHEDEADCFEYRCPGFYRCRDSNICLHTRYLCDGLYQCPQKDDELFCHRSCPKHCVCNRLAFNCNRSFEIHHFPEVRYLEISNSGLDPKFISTSMMLIFLSMTHCNLHHLYNLTFVNLHVLDVSNNQLHNISLSQLHQLPNLRVLILANNPLISTQVFNNVSFRLFHSLQVLDLSYVQIEELPPNMLSSFPYLKKLNLSQCGVTNIMEGSLQTLAQLRVLDLSGCPISRIYKDLFQGLDSLQSVYTDNYKLCCPATLPAGFNLNKCLAPFNEISSCDALLRSDVYRVLLFMFSCFSLFGNACSFLIRMSGIKGKTSGFAVMVIHLSVSDFLMGIYLAILGVADRRYMAEYVWKDTAWRHGLTCKMAGILSLISNEVSAFFIFLITLDRFLALRFPFSRIRFNKTSAMIACSLAWTGGVTLAAIPLLPGHLHWEFYSQSGICIPLPITTHSFAGHSYVFSVMIIFNFVLFILIATGQIFIFVSVRANSMIVTDMTRKGQDLKIARRLISIAISDFACWFPIAVLGVLSSEGVSISSEVSVAIAIIALPLNSALNPFLYNLNLWLEKRRRRYEKNMLKSLMNTK